LVLTLAVNTAAMGIGLFLALWVVKHPLESADLYVFVAVYLILLKLALIVALALLFSCFTTQFLAILFTAMLYVAGVFAAGLRTMPGVNLTPTTTAMLHAISYVLPNFENFNVMAVVAHGGGVPGSMVLYATVYAVVYGAIVLATAAMVFSRRDLK
jgi:ABC-type transport system involved in multi-copper enzyme maturation permease subunit